MRRGKRWACGLLAAATLLAAFPVAALAQSDESPARDGAALASTNDVDRLEIAKERLVLQIERRLDVLERLSSRVNAAQYLSDDHAANLNGDIAAAQTVLTAGIAEVIAVESADELREVAPQIFESTLVFALLVPKAHAVVASDAVAAVTERYAAIAENLQDALDRLAAAGADISVPEAELDQANQIVADLAETAGPVADSVVDLQPGDEFEDQLVAAKQALDGTRSGLREARSLAQSVAAFIRSNLPEAPEVARQ